MSQSPRRHPNHQRPRFLALAALLSALTIACSITPALADQQKQAAVVKDAKGRVVAKIEDDGLGDGYAVIRDQAGNRIGTIQDDGVTGRSVIYGRRGQCVGVIDREPDFSSNGRERDSEDRDPD